MVFIAPQPDLLPKYLALVYPLQLEVWICLVVSVVIFSFLFNVIARIDDMPGRATKNISRSDKDYFLFSEYIFGAG